MKKENKFISWIKNPSADIWLFIVAVVLLNLVASRAFFRIDLTESKSYSLSSSSKEVVKSLEEPLNVKVFFSANLPSPYSNVDQYVKDILMVKTGQKLTIYNETDFENLVKNGIN